MEDTLMFCMNCGTKLPDDAKFCFKCGTKIGTLGAPAVTQSSNDNTQAPAADMDQKQLCSLLKDIQDVKPVVHTIEKHLSVKELVKRAKGILSAQEKNSTPITNEQREILNSKFEEYALLVENKHEEIKDEYKEAKKQISQQKSGCYAYITGSVRYVYQWEKGKPLRFNIVSPFRASAAYNDIFTALSYSELSEMYLDASENSDDEDEEEENYNLFLYCRNLSLAIFKKIALSNSNIEKAIALEYLARYYDEIGDENKGNALMEFALTLFKEVHSQKGEYTFIAAYHIANIYDHFLDDEKKKDKWVNIAFSDYKFYKNQRNKAKDEDCEQLSDYLFAKLCDDYGEDDAEDQFKEIVDESREFADLAMDFDVEKINSAIEENEAFFETLVEEYIGNFRYDLVKGARFDLGDETILIPSTAATYIKLKAPFMRLANQQYIEFLKFCQINVDNLEDVFNKALPKAMGDLEDAFNMGVELANKYGLDIEKEDLKSAVMQNYEMHTRNMNYKHLEALKLVVNRYIEDADIKAREDSNKDYSWVTTAGGFGISGAIGGLIAGSLINAGTNLIANIGRFWFEDTAGQILRSQMNGLYRTYPQISLWIANLMFEYHELIFSYVTDECSIQHGLPDDEQIQIISNSNQEECSTMYAGRGLLDHFIETSVAPEKLREIINFLGYNSYFALRYYNAANGIDIYRADIDALDWYDITKQTLDMLDLKSTAPLNLFSNKKDAASKTTFTAEDLPEDFEDGVFKIPNGYTAIGERAFAYCPSLREVIVPPSVTSVEDGAFSYCRNLLDVSFPRKDYSIGKDVFEGSPHVVVESQMKGSWENYYIWERPSYIADTTIIERRFSEFVLYGRNPYRRNHWQFYHSGTYDIWGIGDILTIQELGEDSSPVEIPIEAITEIKVKTYSLSIVYASQDENDEKRIGHEADDKDWNKVKSLLQYIKHYNPDLKSDAFKVIDTDYGGEPYEPDIEYALPDSTDSAGFLSWKRLGTEIVFGMPESQSTKIQREVLSVNADVELVKIGEKIEKIEDGAFSECAHLRLVQCFNTKCEIGENIFRNLTDVIVRCLPDSDMYNYCLAHHILCYTGEQNPYVYMGQVGYNYYDYYSSPTIVMDSIQFDTYERNVFSENTSYLVRAEKREITIWGDKQKLCFDVYQIARMELKYSSYINFSVNTDDGVKEISLYVEPEKKKEIIEFLYYIASYNEYLWQPINELAHSIDADKVDRYLSECQNKREEIRERIITSGKLLLEENFESATEDTQLSDSSECSSDPLLGEEEFKSGAYAEAMPLLQKEYAQGGTRGGKAALYIGIMCAKGLGVQASIPNAKAWLNIALDLGDDDTKRIAKDWEASLEDTRSSSSSAPAPFAIDDSEQGRDLLLGEEAFKSGKYAEALPLLQDVYAQGGICGGKAALCIGIMCAKGLGMQVSVPNAKAWLNIALDLGDDNTKRIAKDWMSTL